MKKKQDVLKRQFLPLVTKNYFQDINLVLTLIHTTHLNKKSHNKMIFSKVLRNKYKKNLNLQLIFVNLLHPLFLHDKNSTQNLKW